LIVEYHRPDTLDAALKLLARPQPVTIPLAGGTVVNQPSLERVAVVDLQALGLVGAQVRGTQLELGAMLTLQSMLELDALPPALKHCILLEATYNLRQVASVAGTLLAASGRSAFTAAMLALDARLAVLPGSEQIELGEMLLKRPEGLRGRLVTQVYMPLNAHLAYHAVARTPADLPIVSVAVANWPSGRTRVVLGGYGNAPLMALDGPEPGGAEAAVASAYEHAGDEWASAEYRLTTAMTLVRRALAELEAGL
jgi:CO/xanthine dehydrogenase FAD-binding subunit